MSSVVQKEVEIYVIFCKLTSVNTIQGKFEGEIDIVSSWLDTIHGNYDHERHWNPRLVYENIMDKDSKIRTRIEVKPHNDNEHHFVRIVQYQKITGTFSEWLHVKQFPFDVQKLGIIITSLHPISRITLIGKQEYCYLAQKAIRENDSWDFNQTVSIDYSTYQEHTPYLRSQQYPLIKLNALIARKSQFYITNLILPLFFVTSTIFVSFTHDVDAVSTRLSACATTLLTSINFRFIIHNYLPNVPYSTYLDMYSMGSIVFITLVFCWHAYSIKQLDRYTYAKLDIYMLCLFAIIYLLGHVLFIIFAWIIPKRRQKIFLKKMPQTNNISDENQLIELENLLGYERSMDKITID
ncbi:unnamed protein product [Adineta steineri]|nr:unnamed protein product [Adineta steineri]CAF3748560.1 unnamed protein product [Adineta steineri]CAF3784674.1 unnamed protein product [Adineta steineri]